MEFSRDLVLYFLGRIFQLGPKHPVWWMITVGAPFLAHAFMRKSAQELVSEVKSLFLLRSVKTTLNTAKKLGNLGLWSFSLLFGALIFAYFSAHVQYNIPRMRKNPPQVKVLFIEGHSDGDYINLGEEEVLAGELLAERISEKTKVLVISSCYPKATLLKALEDAELWEKVDEEGITIYFPKALGGIGKEWHWVDWLGDYIKDATIPVGSNFLFPCWEKVQLRRNGSQLTADFGKGLSLEVEGGRKVLKMVEGTLGPDKVSLRPIWAEQNS